MDSLSARGLRPLALTNVAVATDVTTVSSELEQNQKHVSEALFEILELLKSARNIGTETVEAIGTDLGSTLNSNLQ